MYSTCLFCHSALGANEVVEHFTVGRRLAFDAAKGRLWVVCRKCERWNLTPVEERWEAIEECERSFRATRLRTSTDEIGMARVSEGLELVRIGKPLRPEFAAWRYGDQFGRRRRNHIVRTTLLVGGTLAIPFAGPALGLSLGGLGFQSYQIVSFAESLYGRMRVLARVRDAEGNILPVRIQEAEEVVILAPTLDEPWGLRIKHRQPHGEEIPWWRYARDQAETDVRGEDALRAAAQLLPRLNRSGASSGNLQSAVAIASETEDLHVAFDRAARMARRSWIQHGKGTMLKLVPGELRLAMEMLSHEESERRALEGELAELEVAWREAEEIAAISDDLFLPAAVSDKIAELKRKAGRTQT